MIEIKDGEIFEKLAKKYNIKYRRTPNGETYEIKSMENANEQDSIDMKKVSDCLYANVPVELRIKCADDCKNESNKQDEIKL